MPSRRAASRALVIATATLALSAQAPRAHLQQPPSTLGVQIELAADQEDYRERIARAAAESLRLYAEWLGPLPSEPPLQITSTTSSRQGRAIALELPWRSAPSAMEIESLVAYRLALQYWPTSLDEPHIARGLAWYLQSRAVEQHFNLTFAAPGHSTESLRLFGGFIPWSLPSLRLGRFSGGLAVGHGRRAPGDLDAPAVRSAMAFATLERYLGWPTLQGALRELAKRGDAPVTLAAAKDVISAASGQNLDWFFDAAFDSTRRIEYQLRDVATDDEARDCSGRPCHRSRVTIARLGDTAFTGSSRPRMGDFEAGRGVQVRVTFADGDQVDAAWDGRDEERVFEFESNAPATVVQLDPRGVMMLDRNALDGSRHRTSESNVPTVKWVARWTVWLQNALLTYAMLI